MRVPMRMDRLPLFERLAPAERILIAGAGGGFDVFAGLPLMLALEGQGKQVHLANLTFSSLPKDPGRKLAEAHAEVDADSVGDPAYFPEQRLSAWFRAEGREVPIHCFDKTGVVPLLEAYQRLVEALSIDTLVLVDGGTDSLMRGDEAGLGTPGEDMLSLAVARRLELPRKVLSCIGFGVDAYHGVCHAQFLEGVAELTRAGAFLGSFSVLPGMPEAEAYARAVDHVHASMRGRQSIVNASVVDAIEGHFGDHHRTERTRGGRLWINPLMACYFSFELDAVADRVLYLKHLMHTRSIFEINAIIEGFRHEVAIRPRETIPV